MVAALVVTGTVAVVLGAFSALAAWARRRGAGHALMAPIDAVWHPTAQHQHVEATEQAERVTPTPAPGDPPGDVRR